MNEERETNKERFRPWWRNCVEEADEEILAIDKMVEAIEPLDEQTTKIRELIFGFFSCYHEADKEADRIVKAIGCGQCPKESNERPPQRKRELQNALDILTAWGRGEFETCQHLNVGPVSAKEMFDCAGQPNDLKLWQVQRIIDQINLALGQSNCYHCLALDIDGYGQPIDIKAEEHYKDHLDFLDQTTTTMIHYTLDGRESKISLAMAIDLQSPCNWNFAGNLLVLLKALNGDLHPKSTFAPCSLNACLSPLRDRLITISNTLMSFWKDQKNTRQIDSDLLTLLGPMTPAKQWLAASFDKTIRLQLEAPADFWLTFS